MPETLDGEAMCALSAETRQKIVRMLSQRPYTASELAKSLGKHVTTISQHLEILEKSGIARRQARTNKWVYYALTEKGIRFTKPYLWVMLSLFLLVLGLYQIFFVRYTDLYTTAAERAPAVAAQTESTNVVIGIISILAAAGAAWYGVRKASLKTGKSK